MFNLYYAEFKIIACWELYDTFKTESDIKFYERLLNHFGFITKQIIMPAGINANKQRGYDEKNKKF